MYAECVYSVIISQRMMIDSVLPSLANSNQSIENEVLIIQSLAASEILFQKRRFEKITFLTVSTQRNMIEI